MNAHKDTSGDRMSQLPNILSLSRIVAAAGLLFATAFSVPFWALYLWCGISDMVDGPLARRLGAESSAGAAIDSIADLVFVVVACFKIIPALTVPGWLWLVIGIVAVFQVARMCLLYFRKGGWAALHDRANKIAGVVLYLSPAILWPVFQIFG